MGTYSFSGQPVFVTVATTGTYDLNAFGGQGGGSSYGAAGGLGAEAGGYFTLTAAEKLEIVVGGSSGGFYGGGGGTFVLANLNGGAYVPILVAGGGGGAYRSTNGGNGTVGASGNGSGGTASSALGGGGGAGVKGNGNSTSTSMETTAVRGGGGGSNRTGSYAGGGGYSQGGFGGGGGGGSSGGGGGGGYTGGAGSASGPGTGGTSYDAGTPIAAQTRTGVRSGNGQLTITPNAVCYCTGTRILTTRGEVAVEDLAVGDLAVTAAGERRPVRWIGRQEVDCAVHPRPHEVMPVRVAAGALGPKRPSHDLWVSPGHALCLDVLGEVLVPACALINGATVAQVDVPRITYWHVELDSHDVLVANGQPAESYIDCGNRAFFGTGMGAVDPDRISANWADYCRPFHQDGALLGMIRERVKARARLLGWTVDDDSLADLHLVVDGVRVEAEMDGLVAHFTVPAYAEEVWLTSDASVPAHLEGEIHGDFRKLGACVASLAIADKISIRRTITLDDARLDEGFWPIEQGRHRWTDGRGRLPSGLWDGCRDVFYLRVDLAGAAVARWVAPDGLALSDAPGATEVAQRGVRLVHAA